MVLFFSFIIIRRITFNSTTQKLTQLGACFWHDYKGIPFSMCNCICSLKEIGIIFSVIFDTRVHD